MAPPEVVTGLFHRYQIHLFLWGVSQFSYFLHTTTVKNGLHTMNIRCMNARSHEGFLGSTVDGDVGSSDGRKHPNGIFGDSVKWGVAMDGRNLPL